MVNNTNYSEITPQILELSKICVQDDSIPKELYEKFNVNRGLRDIKGNGILTGLTEISEVVSKKEENGEMVPCKGELYYRGLNIFDLVGGIIKDQRFGYEETAYLLIFGELPDRKQLESFNELLASYRSLPNSFVRDMIMKAPSSNMMNSLARSVLALYSYDLNPDETSIPNVLRQCLQLIANVPLLSVYGYQAYDYYIKGGTSFFIHEPKPELSTSENILHMLRIDSKYSPLEARILDLALILHAEHGGGNNSSFTTRVVSSSGTDTYSAIAAALGSLKGPKHGGANIKVCEMMEELKNEVKDWNDDSQVEDYILKIVNKEAFDHTGLLYGFGHAVYSISDPREVIFKSFVEKLAVEKGCEEEYKLYAKIEEIAPRIITEHKKIYKGVSANVDFYSGFVYKMLGLPMELFTPIFAISRVVGWSAHRLEELVNSSKIIRPAYKAVSPRREYVEIDER